MTTEQIKKPNFSLAKIIPISLVISTLSQGSVLYYYQRFNFAVTPYMNIEELLFGAIKDLVFTGIFVTILIQVIILLIVKGWREDTYKELKSFRSHGIKHTKKQDKFEIAGNVIIIVFLFIIGIIIIYKRYEELYLYSLLCFIFLGFRFVDFLNKKFIKYTKGKKSYRRFLLQYYPYINRNVLLALIVFLLLYFNLINYKVETVKFNNPYKGSFVELDSHEIIKCTNKVLLIGKTKAYYFFYNTPDSSMRVIDRSKIVKESMKWNNKGMFFLYRF